MNADRVITLSKDIGCLVVGLGGIVWQLATTPDAAVMAVLGGIATIPLVTNVRALRPSSGTEPTRESSSPLVPPSGAPDSSAQSSSP